MSLELPFGLKVINPLPADSKYLRNGVPYDSVAQVNSEIPITIRHTGLTVNILGVEYWYKNGVTNSDLVPKQFDTTLFTAYTAATETRLQNIEGDIVDLQTFSASTESVINDIHSDITYISGITTGKQDQLTAGRGISSTQLTLNRIAVELSGYTAKGSIDITITGGTSDFFVRDNSIVKRGIEYGGNYHSTYSNRSLVDKEYVDSLAAGLIPKTPVNVSTTDTDGNIDLTSPFTSGILDGIPVLDGWRVLIKNQTTPSQNGIYTYNSGTQLFTRATDFDAAGEINTGSFVSVLSGNTLGNTAWMVTSPSVVTINVDPILWSPFSIPFSGIQNLQNVGTGVNVLSGVSSNTGYFKSLVAGNGITITDNGDNIEFEVTATGLTASTIYEGISPASISLGGINAGYVLTGKTLSQIIQDLLVPTLFPTLTNPSNTFSKTSPSGTIFEVGSTINISFIATFNRGSKSPQYSSPDAFRSGLPNRYNYIGTGLPSSVLSTSLTDTQTVTGYTVLSGSNTWQSSVTYDAGTQPYDSSGNPYLTPLPSGTTGNQSVTITGIYPYFYGKVASGGAAPGDNRPTATSALVSGGTKVVASSMGTITITFGATSDDYLWFAIPSTSTSKTVWYVNALNNGSIGGAVTPSGNLFPNFDLVSVTTVLWSGIEYKVYISNYQTATTGAMELRNS